MTVDVVNKRGVSIRLACEVFQISQTCYRYNKKRSVENELITEQTIHYLLQRKGCNRVFISSKIKNGNDKRCRKNFYMRLFIAMPLTAYFRHCLQYQPLPSESEIPL